MHTPNPAKSPESGMTESGIGAWLDDRLNLSALYLKYGRKVFPVHSSYFLGEMALFSFIILVFTGAYLGFVYVPSNADVTVNGQTVPEAYASVQLIESIPVANLFRNVHHWAAHLMIASVLLHLMHIFFTGSYRKPREINWIIGTILLGLTLMAGFVGYSLPYDAYAVTATGIGYSIARSIPWIGGFVSQLFFGGAFPTLGSLARLYTIHVFILPAVITAVVGVHLLVIVKQKHTQPGYARKMAEPGKVLGVPLLPYQALLAGQLFLLMFGVLFVLSSLVTPHPVEAFGPPQAATPEVKPDWYLMWVYGFLKIMPAGASFRFLGATFSPDFLGGLLFPALVFGILTLAPWMDRTNRRAIRRFEYLEPVNQSPIRTGAGVAMLTLIGTMFIAAYYDQIGMSLGVIWSIVIVLPILAGIFAGLVAHTFRGQERFDPHEQLPRVSFAPEAPSPSEQLEAIKSAPTQLQPMRDDVVRTLHELGELAPYVRYLQGDEEIDDLLDTIEDLRTDLGDADGRLRNKVHTRSADGDGEQEPESS